jgi:hypothetical protein
MPSMNLQSGPQILEAAQHLPMGATLVVPQVTWEDYERLLAVLTEHPHLAIPGDKLLPWITSLRKSREPSNRCRI